MPAPTLSESPPQRSMSASGTYRPEEAYNSKYVSLNTYALCRDIPPTNPASILGTTGIGTQFLSQVGKSANLHVKTRADDQSPVPSKRDAGREEDIDRIMSTLCGQKMMLNDQGKAFDAALDGLSVHHQDHVSSANSLPLTPATDTISVIAPATRPASAARVDARGSPPDDEVTELRMKLARAESTLTSVKQQLAVARGFDAENEAPAFQLRGVAPPSRESSWTGYDDSRSDASDHVSAGSFVRGPRSQWQPQRNGFAAQPAGETVHGNWVGSRGPPRSFADPDASPYGVPDVFRGGRLTPENHVMPPRPHAGRRKFDGRYASHSSGFAPVYGTSGSSFDGGMDLPGPGPAPANLTPGGAPMGINAFGGHRRSAGNMLSPHATEFTSASAWKNEAGGAVEGQAYVSPTEPLNYRRLLDRTVNCDWKYIVDKIVCNNDQQASIFLQQKLKVGTPHQKYEIVESIVAQAFPLMVNRFGNFLIQRCFEHGTPEQVVRIAERMRDHTLELAMDPFGCHVVQKAFDSVPEHFKATMVNELLCRIPESVMHRYACHVWQKLFELRWQQSPPQIMQSVNEALCGMWHEVALGETGSLVVQNIFENCLEEDKRPCIEEVLANIDIVAHGQFGNWCIQHVCEHGAPADRGRAIDHVIRFAAKYSTDQFASKVVEKCLKIGGHDFLGRYLERVCEGSPERPRIPLIDIASDQYGNYLIQWILTHAAVPHREIVAAHIRKHMVSLRGSKFGSRVGMLCTNHAVVTRPGPGVGFGIGGGGARMGGHGHHGHRFGGGGGGGGGSPLYR